MLLPTRLRAGTMRSAEECRITGCGAVEHALSLQRAGGETMQQDATVPGSGRSSSLCCYCSWLANVHPRWSKQLLPFCLTRLTGRYASGCLLPRCANSKGRCHAFPVTGSPHCSRRRTPAAVAFLPGLQAHCSWQSCRDYWSGRFVDQLSLPKRRGDTRGQAGPG